MAIEIYRVVTLDDNGSLCVRDFSSLEELCALYVQNGTNDCSIDKAFQRLRLPMFKGLIGPLQEGPTIARYESPKAFEMLTLDWVTAEPVRHRRGRGKR